MNLKGNVLKVETIVISDIPFTEMFKDGYESTSSIALSESNTTLVFNNSGNIKKITCYDFDGEEILSKKTGWHNHSIINAGLLPTPSDLNASDIKCGENGQISKEKIELDNGNVYEIEISYNHNKDISKIKKHSLNLDSHVLGQTFEALDSTTFNYTKFDEYGNWIEVESTFKGLYKRHHYKVITKRQITYKGDSPKPELINSLKQLRTQQRFEQLSLDGECKNFDGVVNLMIPKSFSFNKEGSFNKPGHKQFSYQSENDSIYTCILLGIKNGTFPTLSESDVKELNSSLNNNSVYELLESELIKQETHVLKWLDVKFSTDSQQMFFVRYGNGSPIPVWVKTFVYFKGNSNITLQVACQANYWRQYEPLYDKVTNSLTFE